MPLYNPTNPSVSSVKTSTYAILSTDSTVVTDASAGAFTSTLPSAVGALGKTYTIDHVGSGNSTNCMTLATTSAQTIGGFSSITMVTLNESIVVQSDGANWLIISWKTTTPWIAFTPANTGSWTTNSTYTGKWKRFGDSMQIQWRVSLTGAPNATTLAFNLPTGFTIDTSNKFLLTTGATGSGGGSRGGAISNMQMIYSSTTQFFMVYQSSVTTAQVSLVNATAPVTWANGDLVEASITVPITSFGG